MESKDVAVLGVVAGVVVLAIVGGKAFADAIRALGKFFDPKDEVAETGASVPSDEGETNTITGRILDLNRQWKVWQGVAELTNGHSSKSIVEVQFYAKNRWNIGLGEDDVLDQKQTLTLDPLSKTIYTFTFPDVALVFGSSWEVWLYADGVLIDHHD